LRLGDSMSFFKQASVLCHRLKKEIMSMF